MAVTDPLDPRISALRRLRAQVVVQHETTLQVLEQAEAVVVGAQEDAPLWLTRIEAAEYLKVSLRHLDALLADGRLPCKRLGHSVRISRVDLDAVGVQP